MKKTCWILLTLLSLCSCARHLPAPNGNTNGFQEAEELYQKASSAFQEGRYAEALKGYQRLIAEFAAPKDGKFYLPAGDEAYVAVGDCLFALGRFQEAIEAYQLAIAEYPTGSAHFAPLVKIGDCLMKLNKPEEALRIYRRFEHEYPELSEDLAIGDKIEAARKAINE